MHMSVQIQERVAAGEPIPESIDAIKVQLGLPDDDMLDRWGRSLTIEKQVYNGTLHVFLVSAGSDGRVGTDDDIRSSLDQ